jgi:hypothetical protein
MQSNQLLQINGFKNLNPQLWNVLLKLPFDVDLGEKTNNQQLNIIQEI